MLQMGELQRRYNASKAVKNRFRRDWLLNIAFYLGRQWVVYDAGSHKVREAILRFPKQRYSSNLIVSTVWIQYAKLTRHDPRFRVVVNTTDEDDVTKAKGSTTMLEYFWRSNRYRDAFAASLLWAALCGTSFVKVLFDSDGGDEVEANGVVYKTGTVLVDSCSPFEIYPDPFARTLDEASWVIHERVRPVSYVEAKWGIKPPSEAVDVLQISEPRLKLVTQGADNIPTCVVREYWERPSEAKPGGEYAVWVGNKVLYQGENPYAEAGVPLPFVAMRYLPVPGQLWGDSHVTHLRPVNVMYNMIRSDILDNLMKVSNPMLITPTGALLRPPQFEPGELVEFNPFGPQGIAPLQVEPFPSHAMNMLMRLLQERDDISGVTEVSRGSVPRGVRSAEAMAYLLEQEETRLSIILDEYESAVATTLNYVLRMAREFIELPLVLRVLGENRRYEAQLFKTKDIPPDADVVVEKGSSLARSTSVLQQMVLALWDRGIIRDPTLVLRLTRYGALEEAAADLELDTAQAQRENVRLKEGRDVAVEDFHNHVVHVVEHNRYRKSAEYEDAPQEVKDAFKRHVDTHLAFVRRQMAQEGGSVSAGTE